MPHRTCRRRGFSLFCSVVNFDCIHAYKIEGVIFSSCVFVKKGGGGGLGRLSGRAGWIAKKKEGGGAELFWRTF